MAGIPVQSIRGWNDIDTYFTEHQATQGERTPGRSFLVKIEEETRYYVFADAAQAEAFSGLPWMTLMINAAAGMGAILYGEIVR